MEGLLGRDAEQRRLDQIVAAARQQMSGVLVLRGEPGVGKTALLDYAQAVAGPTMRVIRIDCVESEMELSFAAVHQLLRPLLPALDLLPAPQRTALRVAFGMAEGGPPDRFLVGLAALGLLTGQAAGQPLLCLIDDAHCLDQESADTLAFVARRLHADAIAIVFAVREPTRPPGRLTGLPELRLAGLATDEARALLATAAGPGLRPPLADRIIAETGGNPLALIEIGQELAGRDLDGDPFLPEPLPLGRQLEQRYLREIRALPAATQALLLTAAADPAGDLSLLAQAGRAAGLHPAGRRPGRGPAAHHHPADGPLPAPADPLGGVLRGDLRRAAAGPCQPRRGHRSRRAGPAGLAPGPVQHRAGRGHRGRTGAGRRPGPPPRWLERGGGAVAPRGHPEHQPGRPGPPDAGRRRGEHRRRCPRPGPSRARRGRQLPRRPRHAGLARRAAGRLHHAERQPAAATRDLLAAAATLGPVDLRLARDVLVEAAVEAQINDQLAPDGATQADVARAAQALPLAPGMTPTVGDLLLDADTTLLLHGLAAARPALRRAIDAVRQGRPDAPEMLHWLAAACEDATILGDERTLHELSRQMETAARQHGTMLTLALALSHAGVWGLLAGDLAEARRCFTEMTALAQARDQPLEPRPGAAGRLARAAAGSARPAR